MAKKLVAVIDIGSLTARIKIFEVNQKGKPKEIERSVNLRDSAPEATGPERSSPNRSMSFADALRCLMRNAVNMVFQGCSA